MQWFGFYKSGQAKETIPLQETSLYKEVSSGGWGLPLCPLFAVPEAPQPCSCHSWSIACPCQELFVWGHISLQPPLALLELREWHWCFLPGSGSLSALLLFRAP